MKEQFLVDKISKMSLQNKLGQMIMIDYRDTLEMTVDLEKVLTTYSPGGFIVFKSNVGDLKQTRKLLSDIKEMGDISPIISVDQEGGRVQRLKESVGIETIPPMGEIGKTKSPEEVFLLGKKMGEELKSIGVDMDMAPVLDVLSNPENVIGDRAFGTDPERVKSLALSLANGLKESNVIAVGKHFPGHGDTFKDSHVDLPIVQKNLEELKALELIPFIEAIKKNIPGIMVGHLAVPKITGDNSPASISRVLVTELLRDKLGYDGLVMPDSLKMKALSNYFTESEIYLRCVNSGNDMLLMPQNINVAYDTLYEAVNEGKITEDRVNAAVYRILSLKFDYGFFDKEYSEYLKTHQDTQYVNSSPKHR
jgi:beta-N-acetylhexosaminidase